MPIETTEMSLEDMMLSKMIWAQKAHYGILDCSFMWQSKMIQLLQTER
jgi:hypothetical protein